MSLHRCFIIVCTIYQNLYLVFFSVHVTLTLLHPWPSLVHNIHRLSCRLLHFPSWFLAEIIFVIAFFQVTFYIIYNLQNMHSNDNVKNENLFECLYIILSMNHHDNNFSLQAWHITSDTSQNCKYTQLYLTHFFFTNP